MNDRQHSLGVLALTLAGILFGLTFIVVDGAIDKAEVSSFLAVRFLIAAAVLAPFLFRRARTPGEIRHGVLAGLCLLGGYVLQTVGLYDTTPATSAFLTYLLVVIVPVIAAVRFRKLPRPHVLLGVALAVAGLVALSGAGGPIGRGEFLTLGCALMFALHIMVLSEVAHRHSAMRLAFWQVFTVGAACLIPGALAGSGPNAGYSFGPDVWLAAAFCGVGATAVAFLCQSWAQKVVPGSQAAVILLLEPVSAGIIGQFTGTSLGMRGLVGAGLILLAVLATEVLGRERPAVLGAELAMVTDPDLDELADS